MKKDARKSLEVVRGAAVLFFAGLATVYLTSWMFQLMNVRADFAVFLGIAGLVFLYSCWVFLAVLATRTAVESWRKYRAKGTRGSARGNGSDGPVHGNFVHKD